MLNKPILVLFVIISLISCNHKGKKQIEDRVKSTDTTCLEEIKRAKSEIKKNKLTYCHYAGNILFQPLRGEREMDSLLKLYKVSYENELSPCIIDKDKNYHCYCELMQEQIDKKFGNKFTDSLLYVADSLYISKHLKDTFDYGAAFIEWDKPPMFPGDSAYDQTNHSGLQKQFEKLIVYPKGYRFKKVENSMADIQVLLNIDDKGKAKVTSCYFNFWDSRTKEEDYNKEYWAYFKGVAIPLIENTTWIPAKVKSFNVISKNDIYIYLK